MVSARPRTISCGFEASEAIPFPGRGFNFFKLLRRHFRATPFCSQVENAGIVSVPDAPAPPPSVQRVPWAFGTVSRKIEISFRVL